MPAALVEMYGNGHQQPPITSLHATLQHIISGFDKAYIIIDSLDECANREKLLAWIKMTIEKTDNLHLLVTSRPERDIESLLGWLAWNSMNVAAVAANSDIKAYIDVKLDLPKWKNNPGLQNLIRTTLLEKANGMYVSCKL